MLTRVAAFPIGMDPSSFAHALRQPDVRSNISQLLQRYAGRKVSRSHCLACCIPGKNSALGSYAVLPQKYARKVAQD